MIRTLILVIKVGMSKLSIAFAQCLFVFLQRRVRSWLRMNAGGVDQACKSNENVIFGLLVQWRTGE